MIFNFVDIMTDNERIFSCHCKLPSYVNKKIIVIYFEGKFSYML